MRHPFKLAAAAFLALPLTFAACGQEEEQIRATYAAFQKAITDSKAADAAKMVDSWSANWYAEAARHAATADQFVLEQLDPLMIQTVLRMRSVWTRSELLAMQGRDALAAAIDRGWAGRDDLEAGLAEVRVNGAEGQASTATKPKDVVHQFRREGDTWYESLRQRIQLKAFELRKRMVDAKMTAGQFAVAELRKFDPSFDERLLIGPRLTKDTAPVKPSEVVEPKTAATGDGLDDVPVVADEPMKPTDVAKPADTPTKPDESPKPAETPAKPADTPAKPADTPAKPTETPASGTGGLIPKRPTGGTGDPDAPAKTPEQPKTPEKPPVPDDPETPAQ